MRHQYFAVCAPGLEELVAGELDALGIRTRRPVVGGVTFDATARQLYAVNVWSRVATRVLARVDRFAAQDFTTLRRRAEQIDWGRWLQPDTPVRFRVSSSASRLFHTGAIEERLREVLGAQAAVAAVADDATSALVVVRVVRDVVTVSIDTSGAPLHQRGWRRQLTKATLRETLAAAMVLASTWDREQVLVDPFCGSGTIAIEAALLAMGRAPGADRDFGFQRWPSFEPGTWSSVRATVLEQARVHSPSTRIVARDRDAGAVEIARANAARAGVDGVVDIERATVSDLRGFDVDDTATLITNPPYGRRVSKGNDLRDLYAQLGNVVRASNHPWRIGLLVADERTAGHARFDLSERFRTRNGGIPVRYLVGSVGDPAVAS